MNGKCLLILTILFLFIGTSSYAATFTGKVIDADTKEPIVGAVVVAAWYGERATIAGPVTRLKDVKETLTDKNGEWVIKGPRGQRGGDITALFTFLTGTYYTQEPVFIIFKPGYCSWPEGFSIYACEGKLKPGGIGEIIEGKTIELPKLTNREDRLKAHRISPFYPDDDKKNIDFLKKQIELLRLLNEESRYLGLDEYTIYKELRDDK